MSVDHIGPHGYSWVDAKAVHDNLLPATSAYYRVKFPEDWFWADIQTRLAAYRATATEKVHYLLAAQMFETVPPEFQWVRYGPSDPDDDVDESVEQAAADVELARAVAADMRG